MISVILTIIDGRNVHESEYPFSTKQKACEKAVELSQTINLSWGCKGTVQVFKNCNLILELPIN